MKYSKSAIGLLTREYRSVLKKCLLINLGLFALGAVSAATPAMAETYEGHTGDSGALNIIDKTVEKTDAVIFQNNESTSHGAGLYSKVTTAGVASGATFNGNVTFNNNEVLSAATSGSGAGAFVSGGNFSFLGANNSFTNNHMNATIDSSRQYKVGGGAVANQSYADEHNGTAIDATMVIGTANSVNTFSGNTSSTNGGAIMNRAVDSDGNATMTINGTTTFSNNSATQNGGAIYNVARDDEASGHIAQLNLNNGTYTFTGNTATKFGGAVYNSGTMTVKNGTFGGDNASLGNKAKRGGALYNMGNTTVSDSSFSHNSTETQGYGGAIFNSRGLLTLNNVNFSDNTADWDGGAISSATSYFNASSKPADFTGDVINESTVRAYWNTKNGFDAANKMVINNSTFDNNKVTVYSGGALGVYSDAVINGSHFTNNNAGGNNPADPTDGGGAIYAGGWARVDVSGSDFSGNSSNYGGAIATTRAGKENGVYLHITDSEFTNNTATVAGGAISNAFADAVFTDTNFNNNSAAEKGGAIYNTNGLTIAANAKDVTFSGNTANNEANDIYNIGTLSLNAAAGRNISLAGGIDGDSVNKGTVNIAGDVEVSNALKNQTVAHNSGELHLKNTDLTGSTINVAADAIINTIATSICFHPRVSRNSVAISRTTSQKSNKHRCSLRSLHSLWLNT